MAYVDSEVGRLRTVLLHRPGRELGRLTPRNNEEMLFDGVPWVARAQEEHDAFAALLRERGVEVLLLGDLLVEALAVSEAREEAIGAALASAYLGHDLRTAVSAHLRGLHPMDLADALVAGVTREELPVIVGGVVARLMSAYDVVIAPLPNLIFTRDSSVRIGNSVAVTRPALRPRTRESTLTRIVHTYTERLRDAKHLYEPDDEPLEGGDVLLLGPGVVAVGVGERTTAAGAERLARAVLGRGLAHTVLVVPIPRVRATMHLDTIATMVDHDAVVMYPALAETLRAHAVTGDGERLDIGPEEPFLHAGARALGLASLRVIDTGLHPVVAEREQWDDGNNTLALAPRVCIAYERNVQTNRRLEEAGIEILAIAGSELGSGRGGPRCLSCPIDRDPEADETLWMG